MMWTAGGTACLQLTVDHGALPRRLADQRGARFHLAPRAWRPPGTLTLIPPNGMHSVWWLFADDNSFDCWYVNLEEAHVRWSGGIDTADSTLDIVGRRTAMGNTFVWKDEDEFAERIGHPWYWNEPEAEEIQAEGERVAAQIVDGQFPFDGRFCDFLTSPDFRPERGLPAVTDLIGYDHPRAEAGLSTESAVSAANPDRVEATPPDPRSRR